jgi:long-chain acyl-CoA synthetase
MLTAKRLFDIPFYQLERYPTDNMFVTKKEGIWTGISTQNFVNIVNETSRGLISLGIQPKDKIALISNNRVEWNIMDIAIQQVGAIVVPIYPNISSNDYKYIFNDAEIKLCTVGSKELFETIDSIKTEIPSLTNLYIFDKIEGLPNWEIIQEEASKIDISEVEDRKKIIENLDLATIIYTSGTTGNPKGVMLSHNNLLSNVEGCISRIPADNNSNVLTFLPACHVYERMLHYLYMYLGCRIHYAESLETIGENIKEVHPEIFTAVPRLIEKVFEKIIAKGDELTGIKRKLFFWAVKLGEEYEVEGKSAWYKIKLAIANKIIFSKWREALGGKVRAIASGSAALQPRLARIFLAAKIPILEGYGLTETSPVVAVNCFKKGMRIGTVGPLLDNVQVRFGDDGEILVKGPNVMMGYYKLPEKTKEDIDENGWFHTGDIGIMEDERFLKITDRKKEIFKTSGGKYIAPQAMENKFKESRFIEQIIVIGENEKFPSAFIVPNFAFIRDWAPKNNLSIGNGTNKDIIESEDVKNLINTEVETFNKFYGHWEQLKRFELLDHELSIDTGELTPTLKPKRKVILEKYKELYNKIYCD